MTDHGKILVVDDDPMFLKMLPAALGAAGYQALAASSGESALELVAKEEPELIILDIDMPGMGGLEACRHIKSREASRHIPVIFLSACTRPEERIQCFKLGAVDLVSKPTPREELLARVRIHLSHSRMESELKQQAENLLQFNKLLETEVSTREELALSLKESEERLNMALDAARMGSFERKTNGDIWRSRRHDEIFGHNSPLDRWTDTEFFGRILPEDRKRVEDELAPARKGGPFQSEFRIIRANDQSLRWISLLGKTAVNADGSPGCASGVVMDITERKIAELELQEAQVQTSLSQKLESVGRLASGVAHEINTPMQFITDNTQFLKQALSSLMDSLAAYRKACKVVSSGGDPAGAVAAAASMDQANDIDYLLLEIPKTFEETMGGLQRVTHIIKSLKEFSHPSTTDRHPADLNKAINTTIAVSRHEWKYVAEVVVDLVPDLPLVPLCVDEMNQVFLNLIVNAAHAIGDAVRQRGEEKGVITVRTRLQAGSALVEVEDNGTGIPEPAQAHIFEPFFTTKGVGKGTGQGLALVRAIIVKNHGGTITFSSTPGKGTTFQILLPLVNSTEDATPSPSEASQPR